MPITTLRRIIASTCVLALASAWGQAPPPAAPAPAQTPPAQAPPAAAPAPAPRVVGAVNFNNQPLLEVINVLAQELHINYILDASVRGGTVTINTYGAGQGVELRPLFETILRMNNLAMVQAGDIYRIVPLANIARQPVQPISQTDPSKVADDERLVLNLVFLRFVTSGEMAKVLAPFIGDGGQLQSYDPANLLIILDNSRNMRRTLELVAMFDSDAFAGQRVRAFEVRNGRPSDIAKELEEIFKAYSLSGGKGNGAVQFLPVDRVSTVLAIAPNPGAFAEVEKWIQKLDITPKSMAGGIQNFVYKLKYGRAEILGSVINQLYGGCSTGIGFGGGYGISGNSSYPSQSYAGVAGNVGGGYGSPYGGNAFNNVTNGLGYGASQYGGGGGYGSPYGGGGYSANCAPAGYSSPYSVTTNNPALGAFGVPASPAPTGAATGSGSTNPSPSTTAASTDQTGSYLSGGASGGAFGQPRIVPNPFDNTLIVQSSPDQWEQIKGLLDQLDVSPRQVLIDAKVFEVDLSGSFAAGVEAYLQQKGATNPAGITTTQLLGSSNAAGSATLLLTAGTLVGQSRELLALLTLQETRTRAKVLSAPSVIATDSIPASITVGDSVPTLTSQAVNPGVTNGGNSLFTQTISNTSTGIGLNILARVNSSGIVTMVINQNVTAPEPNPTGANINSPSFSQRNVSTQVTVQDGDTIAIGGIINESTTETASGIPFLDRLPYIGAAFGMKTNTKKRSELIIFLTPRVIYDTNQIADATQELKDKVKNLKKVIRNE
jgi:general secretion pathway protein D